MFGRVPYLNPFEQLFGAYPVHQLQQYPIGGLPHQAGMMGGGIGQFGTQGGGFGVSPWQGAQAAGYGPISPLVPQQGPQFPFVQQQLPIPPAMGIHGLGSPFGAKMQGLFDPSSQYLGGQTGQVNPLEQILGIGAGGGQFGQSPFGQSPFGQSPFGIAQGANQPGQIGQFGGAQQGWQQGWQPATVTRDPRAELLASAIAQITATRDPRVEYLAQFVTHPAVASNPVLKDLVAKELLTAALQQVASKATRPDVFGQSGFGGGQIGIGQGLDPYTAAAVKSQVLAELANTQLSQLLQGGPGQGNPQFSMGTPTVI